MSNISKNSGTNVGIELTSITVAGESGGRGECWKFNISNQFPIIPSNIENGEVIVSVDSPHKGYSIQTVMENGKMNGESRILNKEKIKVASLVFVDGIANGPCKLYDEEGSIVFEGYLKNGYREGKGKEYDEDGNVVYEGFYKQGKRMNIVELKEMKGYWKEMKGYWKEMNERNEVISICKKDEEGKNDGICYFYSNGEIDRISEWKNGEEISDSGYCQIYDEPHCVFFEGHFEHGKREGKGKEINDNGRIVYDGLYNNGKRINMVVMKEMKGYWKEMNEDNEVISICKKNDKFENDGICYFYSNGNIDRISEWKNGEEISDSGDCRIFDEPHCVFFEGHFEHGKREGKGKEIDLNGKVVFDGFYEHGKKLNIIPMKEMKGYWKEMNEENEVISICKTNENNKNDGICYFYSNGEIDKVSEWKNGEELNVLKRFEGNKMIEFVNGVKRYEGEYRDSIKHNYPREGKGKEYDTDGESLVYHGYYWNNKRQGKGKLYRNGEVIYNGMWIMGYPRRNLLIIETILLVLILVCIIVSFIVNVILGCIVVSLAVILLVLWRCNFHVRIDSDYRLITTVSLKKKLVVRNRCCNLVNTLSLPQFYYEKLIIGNDCFENVELFNIDGLDELRSLKIGKNSFTKEKNGCADDPNRSFSILNCIELESIEIGRFSFSDYGGGFELRNLPKLSTIKIGKIGSYSSNFRYSSFVITGIIDMILLMNRSSTFEFD